MKCKEVKVNNREEERFNSFKEEIQRELFEHPVIINNPYTKWFKQGIVSELEIDLKLIGKWKTGTKATHQFLEQLDSTYGCSDVQFGAGASFAIETWAAFGIGQGDEKESNNFWKELIVGVEGYNRMFRAPNNLTPLPTGFFFNIIFRQSQVT